MSAREDFIKEQNRELVRAQPIENLPAMTPAQLLQVAVQRGEGLDYLRELMQLEREWKADRARDAYTAAMAAFKSEPLSVRKNKHVKYTTTKGTTEYDHPTLDRIVDVAAPLLSKHGLSHRWETTQADNKLITVTCVITHQLGHSERTPLTAAPDDSGGKNSIQAMGSTITYLERYTFMAATGIAAKGQDDDGRGASVDADPITEEQLANLEALISEVGANKSAFLKVCKVDELAHLPAAKYSDAVKRLEEKRKQ